jgi:hypothetical protein
MLRTSSHSDMPRQFFVKSDNYTRKQRHGYSDTDVPRRLKSQSV